MNIKMCEHWSVWLYWWQDFLNLNYNPHQFLHSNPSIVWQSQQDLCWKIYGLSHTVSKNDPYWVLWEQIDTWSEYQNLAIVVAHTGHPWATVNCAVEVFQTMDTKSRHAGMQSANCRSIAISSQAGQHLGDPRPFQVYRPASNKSSLYEKQANTSSSPSVFASSFFLHALGPTWICVLLQDPSLMVLKCWWFRSKRSKLLADTHMWNEYLLNLKSMRHMHGNWKRAKPIHLFYLLQSR